MTKLTERNVVGIRQGLLAGSTVKHIAKVYGVGTSTISDIKNGVTWKKVA